MNKEFRPTMKLRHVWHRVEKHFQTDGNNLMKYESHLAVEQWWEEGNLVRGNDQGFVWLPTDPPKGEWRLIDMGEVSK